MPRILPEGPLEPIRNEEQCPVLTQHRWVAYTVLSILCLTSIAAGVVTIQYQPEFFDFPNAWGVAFMLGGLLGLSAVVWPTHPKVALWAGAAMSGLAVSRGLFIGAQLSLSDWVQLVLIQNNLEKGIAGARAVAAFQWSAYGILILVSWPALIHDTRASPRLRRASPLR